jgi:hypothetical protein
VFPNALRWRIDYYFVYAFVVRNLSNIAHTQHLRGLVGRHDLTDQLAVPNESTSCQDLIMVMETEDHP